jgi:hypothetical protein
MGLNYNSRTGDFDGGDGEGPGCFAIAAIVFGIIAIISLIMSFFF